LPDTAGLKGGPEGLRYGWKLEADSMARGWESKSVEAQQDEAARGSSQKPALTEQQRAKADRRRTLDLTRARALNDLSRATSPAHRHMLQQALAVIDEQLAALTDS
jgi:hypothetical protein